MLEAVRQQEKTTRRRSGSDLILPKSAGQIHHHPANITLRLSALLEQLPRHSLHFVLREWVLMIDLFDSLTAKITQLQAEFLRGGNQLQVRRAASSLAWPCAAG
jgi:hypothetical protein